VEQSINGGSAHFLNFICTETNSAAFYVQYHLNNGVPVGESIPATEHSVMTAWPTEADAIRNMIKVYGGEGKLFATVMDSYDYENALDKVVPLMVPEKIAKDNGKGIWVLRPDSGDPTDCVIKALQAGDKCAGHVVNSKGFKVLKGINVIQGDGVDYHQIRKILDAVLASGYSAQNVAFGMGGGLLQNLNNYTMAFTTKLNYIQHTDGTVMKSAKTDILNTGILKVKRINKIPTVFPAKAGEKDSEDLLITIYDNGPVDGFIWPTFTELRERVNLEWHTVPKTYNPISAELRGILEAGVKD
jgi:nicotinamide phosphoribosyltransferase